MKKSFLILFVLCSVAFSYAAENMSPATMYARPTGGFVLIDDATGVLIGFSDKGEVKSLTEDARRMFASFGREVRFSQEAMPAQVLDMLTAETTDSVGPLLGDIMYGQGDPFRANAPVKNGQRCLAGCVAVAMAQIMVYHQHPKTPCHGSVKYKTETLNFTIDLDLEGYVFDWANILPNYMNGYNATQASAVADLMYACGATTHMDFNLDGSGTNTDWVMNALMTHFDYDHSIAGAAKADYTDVAWNELLQSELNAERPMLMRSNPNQGAGHAYVLDGYKVQKGYEKYPFYHFNWGWEGYDNGWFMLANLQAGSYDLRFNQAIIHHIAPKGSTPIDNVESDVQDNAIYDLLGRRIAAPIPGHIYIQAGKKFLAK